MKIRVLSLITLLCTVGSFSASAETVGEALQKCRSTDNSLKRLVCYDGVAKSLAQYDGVNEQVGTVRPMPMVRAEGASQTQQAQSGVTQQRAPQIEPANDFGLENRIDPTKLADSLALSITEIATNSRGRFVITFDDASVWEQTERSTLKVKVGQSVTIERGLLGAFFMGKEGSNKRMKLKRLK